MQTAEAAAELEAASEAKDAHAAEGERVQKELQGHLDYIGEKQEQREKLERRKEAAARAVAKVAQHEAEVQTGLEAVRTTRDNAAAVRPRTLPRARVPALAVGLCVTARSLAVGAAGGHRGGV